MINNELKGLYHNIDRENM